MSTIAPSANGAQFVVYWLGYHNNPPPIQSCPNGTDVVNLFLLNLATSPNDGTCLNYDYITSKGKTWTVILEEAHLAQAKGMKVFVSVIPPNGELTWNTIPDPDAFAKNAYKQIRDWGLDGLDIDPEMGGVLPNSNFVTVISALSKYFGPKASTGLGLSLVSYEFSSDKPLLGLSTSFDRVMLMGYFWGYSMMITQFTQYATLVDSEKLLFGIGGDPWGMTPLDVALKLAKWQPAQGSKGGMMEFNINDDPNFAFANAIIRALSSNTRTMTSSGFHYSQGENVSQTNSPLRVQLPVPEDGTFSWTWNTTHPSPDGCVSVVPDGGEHGFFNELLVTWRYPGQFKAYFKSGGMGAAPSTDTLELDIVAY